MDTDINIRKLNFDALDIEKMDIEQMRIFTALLIKLSIVDSELIKSLRKIIDILENTQGE